MEQQFVKGGATLAPPTVTAKKSAEAPAAPRRSALQMQAARHSASRILLAHLETLLTLKNASESKDNLVIAYGVKVLEDLGRQVNVDKRGNIWCPADAPFRGNLLRGVVAHTDSVMQNAGHKVEPVIFERGVFRSKQGKRPIGGDDKVGVAIALTIAELFPEFSVTLPADEEVGLKGAHEMTIPRHNLLVECDRKGSVDLVHTISNQPILSQEAVDWIGDWLPHRNPTAGGRTDVLAFVNRDMADNATNLSCGYYKPHDKGEIVVFAHVYQTYLDAVTLLCDLPLNIKTAKKDGVRASGTVYHNGYSGNNYSNWNRGTETSTTTNTKTLETAGHIESSDMQIKLDAMMPRLFRKEEGAVWDLAKSGTLDECGFVNLYERKHLPKGSEKWTWFYCRDVRTAGTYLRNEETGDWYIHSSYMVGWVKWDGSPMVYVAGGMELAPPPSSDTPAPPPSGDGAGQGFGTQVVAATRSALPLTARQREALPGMPNDMQRLHIIRDGETVNYYVQNLSTKLCYCWNGTNDWKFMYRPQYDAAISLQPTVKHDAGAAFVGAEEQEGVTVLRASTTLDSLGLPSHEGLPESIVKPNLSGAANVFDYVVRWGDKWLHHVKSRQWFRFNSAKWVAWLWGPFSEEYEASVKSPAKKEDGGVVGGGADSSPFVPVASLASSTEAGIGGDDPETATEETLLPGVTMQDTGTLLDFGMDTSLRVGLHNERTDHWTYIERENGVVVLLFNTDSERWYVRDASRKEWFPVNVGPSSTDGQPTALDISAALTPRLLPQEAREAINSLFTDSSGRDVTSSTFAGRDIYDTDHWGD